MNQDLEAVRDQLAQDNNRAVLRSVVGHIREHHAECHPGEDVDCAGVMAALDDSSRWEVLTLLQTALCQLARLPDSHEAALELLDFTPDPATSTTPERKGE